jgi:hypothetical protein
MIHTREIYGIRCLDNDNRKNIIFELHFRSFGVDEKHTLNQYMKTEANHSNVFQLFRAYSSSNNIFCPNWDENRFFMWVDTELSVIEDLLN